MEVVKFILPSKKLINRRDNDENDEDKDLRFHCSDQIINLYANKFKIYGSKTSLKLLFYL